MNTKTSHEVEWFSQSMKLAVHASHITSRSQSITCYVNRRYWFVTVGRVTWLSTPKSRFIATKANSILTTSTNLIRKRKLWNLCFAAVSRSFQPEITNRESSRIVLCCFVSLYRFRRTMYALRSADEKENLTQIFGK